MINDWLQRWKLMTVGPVLKVFGWCDWILCNSALTKIVGEKHISGPVSDIYEWLKLLRNLIKNPFVLSDPIPVQKRRPKFDYETNQKGKTTNKTDQGHVPEPQTAAKNTQQVRASHAIT